MAQAETKKTLESKIKNHVVNVLFNVKGVEGIYPTSNSKSNTSKRATTLKVSNSVKGIKVDWVSDKLVDITIKIKVSAEISIRITYNLLNNLISDHLNKLPKVKLNTLYLEIEDVK